MVRKALFAVCSVVLVGAAVVVSSLTGLGLWLSNVFGSHEHDRTGAPVLQSLVDLSEFHAVSGHFEVVVDIQDDPNVLPDWLSGERLLYVGKGDVDAVVDFSALDERRVSVSPDGTTATIRLPAPTLAEPNLDIESSYVVSHDAGLTTFGGSKTERDAQLRAIKQISEAAGRENILAERAKENTEEMLRSLITGLGVTTVDVHWDQ